MKSKTLKENKDFRRLYYRGKSVADSCLVTYAMKNHTKEIRIGIASSKKIGNAVKRNRARRVIRAAYSALEESVGAGWDIVFVARTRTTEVKMQAVNVQMKAQLKKLGVIN
ncbi:MAG: ribonuclease P protein component [Clostridiales bacterium]|nr:ribonuclease P protein component [Clostridiales bacterium]